MANNRIHQLRNGLYVSAAPDKQKDRLPIMTSTAMPYTGGDIKKSGELGKMFDIAVEAPRLKKSGPIYGGTSATSRPPSSNSGPLSGNGVPTSIRSSVSNSGPQAGSKGHGNISYSGPLFRNADPANVKAMNPNSRSASLKNSGPQASAGMQAQPMPRQNSGPLAPPNLPATGLITSGPISSGPLSASRKHSGPLETVKSSKSFHNQAVNNLTHCQSYSFRRSFPRIILWTVIPLFVIGLVAGSFILGAVQNAVLLIVVVSLLSTVLLLLVWNSCVGAGAVTGFVAKFPCADLNQAKDGQYVKVTGVVTCGNVPLETSYQRVSRCVYTSSGLYEYRGLNAKPASSKHWIFTWGLRHLERQAADFYISDFQSGLRALVKAGYSATVTPYVEESTVVDVNKTNSEIPSRFLQWLGDRSLSSDDRIMKLKEGYIKEGFTVTVMGVVQRSDNVLMIVPPSEPVSTGCQWGSCLLPATMEGLILRCENTSKVDVIPV